MCVCMLSTLVFAHSPASSWSFLFGAALFPIVLKLYLLIVLLLYFASLPFFIFSAFIDPNIFLVLQKPGLKGPENHRTREPREGMPGA